MMMMIAWNFHGTILAISDESIVHAFLLLSTYVVAVAIIIAEYCHKSMKTKKKHKKKWTRYSAYAYMVMWSWTVRSMNLVAIAIDINSKDLQAHVQENIIEFSAAHIQCSDNYPIISPIINDRN